jgi:hypothetical protein
MKMTHREAKKLVSGLRRELKLGLSHTQTCELVARSLGATNWSTLSAGFIAEEKTGPASALLCNEGQFDFAPQGALISADFKPLLGTVEDIPACLSRVTAVSRNKAALAVEWSGTEVNWDDQKTRLDAQGLRQWFTVNGTIVSEAQCIVVPTNYAADLDENDPHIELDARPALVGALVKYLKAHGLVNAVREELALDLSGSETLEHAQQAIGFYTIYPERVLVQEQLA